MAKTHEMNLSEGSILKKMIVYALPLIATNVLQLLFNAADIAVLGQFVGENAVAAVGSTTALITLVTGLFIGLSVSANVMIARYAGSGDRDGARRTVGMSVFISVLFGVLLMAVGFFFSRTFLQWMDCAPAVLDMATKYLQIYFLGMPLVMLYNYCASILRAVGDTFRPFIFLVIGGVANVGLNLLFVLVFHQDVAGVAIATITSQGISAILCLIVLKNNDGYARLEWKYVRIYKKGVLAMLRIGLPAGIQGCLFSLSNVLIQSSINGFGEVVVAANTVAGQVDGFIYNAMLGVALSALAFIGQNLGAGNVARVKRSMWTAVGLVTFVGVIVGVIVVLLRSPLARIISKDEAVVEIASMRMVIIGLPYFLCGVMDVLGNSLRGMGRSTLSMIITLSGSCLFRILWLLTIFKWNPTLTTLYWVYPVSWFITAAVQLLFCSQTLRTLEKRYKKDA